MTTTLVVALVLLLGCDKRRSVRSESSAKPVGTAVADSIPQQVESGNEEPVSLHVSLDRDQAVAGQSVTLSVACKIHPDFHIYSVQGPTGVAQPTKLVLTLPEGLTRESEWRLPASKTLISHIGPEAQYAGDVRFSVPLKIDERAAAGPVNLRCEFHYQACTKVNCRPPTSETLEIPLVIVQQKEDENASDN